VKQRVERVLIVGLDGATLDLVQPWVRQGHLPVLAGLMKQGSYAPLRSVYPVLSSAAWSSFMTGLNPGKHGIYDFVIRNPETYQLRPVSRYQMHGRSLWRMLSDNGLNVCVLNVPMTYPPEPVNGRLVSGLGTPDFQQFTQPEELGDELLRSGYRVNRRVFGQRQGEEKAFLDDTYDISDHLTSSALRLMAEQPWDLFAVVYRDTDEVAHHFWSHMDESHPAHDPLLAESYGDSLLECYQRLDGALGDLVRAAGPNCTVFVVSDHGTGPLYKDVFLNEWLHQQGFLVPASAPDGLRAILTRLGVTRSNASRVLRASGLHKVEHWIKGLLGDRISMLPRDSWGDFSDAVDWRHTKAYSYGYYGQIYLNVKGREPQGVVGSGAEFMEVREQITDALRKWNDPVDGEPVVSAVYSSEEVFEGPFIDRAPDLTVIMRDLAYVTRSGREFSREPGSIFASPLTQETGSHRLNGILIAAGAGLADNEDRVPEASLMDITPTVLHLLGVPVPNHLDGRVLSEYLAPEWRSQEIDRYTDEDWMRLSTADGQLEGEEEQEVVDRLRNLGYL
jgi:predicted AlkP superfamily phosphohydrolase/phosphomutase